jgi:hypothetical protein
MASKEFPTFPDDLDRVEEDLEYGHYQLINLKYSLRFQRLRFFVLATLFVVIAAAVIAASIGRFTPALNFRKEFSSELSTAFAILGIFLVFEIGSACIVAAAAYLRGLRLEEELQSSLRDAEQALEAEGAWHAA